MILNFVVAMNECVVHAHPQDTLRTCVDIAFQCTRYKRNAFDGESRGWEVRDNEGRLLNEDVIVSDLTSSARERIYVNLPAGTGA